MAFEDSTLTLSGETRAIKSLDFFVSGEVGKTDKKGETTVVCGEYTFLVTQTTLRYRFKPKGARASKPVKELKSFAELGNLPIVYNSKVENQTNNTSATSTKEEPVMAKLNLEGKQVEIPANVQKILTANGVKDSVVELSQIDEVQAKVKGADLAVLNKFEEEVIAPAFEKDQAKVDEAKKAAEAKADAKPATPAAPATPETPATPADPAKPAGVPDIPTSSLFTGAQASKGSQGGRAQMSDAEKQRRRYEREQKKEQDLLDMKQSHGRIEEVRKAAQAVEGTAEATRAAKELLLIDGRLPLFKTLVSSDSRLRPRLRNHVSAKDRVLHPNIASTHVVSADGKIEEKYALADYTLDFVESNVPQPTGYFIYVPECLLEMNPSNFSLFSERERFIQALETGSRNLTIKYVTKADLVHLLVILGGQEVKVQEYNQLTKKFNELAPYIHVDTRTDKSGETVYTLRAKDAHDAGIKLSIRNFIPISTHDTISAKSTEFDAKLTTKALFKRMLFDASPHTQATKFSQLQQKDQLAFSKGPDGEYTYTKFTDVFTVDAYDQNKNSKHQVAVKLPLVKEQTSTSGTTRTVFVKSKFNDDNGNYNKAYLPAIHQVGDQMNRTKKKTTKAIKNTLSAELHMQEGLLALVSGGQINIK